jgi:hypothetical protein
LSFAVLDVEPRALHMLGKHSTTEPYHQSLCIVVFLDF